jgi:hypothetical protein
MTPPIRFVVHSLDHARAVLVATQGRPVGLDSPPATPGWQGIGWWRELLRQVGDDFPDAIIDAVLDCGDAPGHVLAALRAGIRTVRVDAPAEVIDKLRAMGAELRGPAPALDLATVRDVAAACRNILKPHPEEAP